MALQTFLLGAPRFESDGETIHLPRRKAVAILAYLAVTEQVHTRDSLATLFWAEKDQSSALANLRRELSRLKKILGEDVISVERDLVSLHPQSDIELDVKDFQERISIMQQQDHTASSLCADQVPVLSEAVALYAGDFMAGFSLPDSPAFDDWQFFQAESLRQKLAEALQWLIQWHSERKEFEQGIEYARRWLALDNLHEPVHRQLILLYAWSGQHAAALRQYKECIRLLKTELGVEPEAETTTLYEEIRARKISSPAQADLTSSLEQLPETERHLVGTSSNFAQAPSFLGAADTVDQAESPIFVAREGELARLGIILDQALAGQGQVAFVIGDAGRGKTVLVQEFMEQSMEEHPDLVAVAGNCSAYTGVGDPYLPFREILELLTGDVEARWEAGSISLEHARRLWDMVPRSAAALVDSGPELIDVFISSLDLSVRARAAASVNVDSSSENGWLTRLETMTALHARGEGQTNVKQSDLFEQYARVLQKLAGWQPLMLVVDDLQWSDSGSINLLFHLGRRLTGSPILIIGVYRPDDVALGRDGQRHPLEPVVHEFQRQFGDILIDLRQAEGRHFVEAYLHAEPNQFSPAFLEALHQHTAGHALFTAEMLRGLKERGDLIKDKHGSWISGPDLNWEILPARIEGVIGERIDRLPAELHEVLLVASVEGEVFTAEVVARTLSIDERDMVRQLSGVLDKRHRLVRGQGSHRLGSQRLSHYRFRHILFQRYLYSSLDEVERKYLHETVGKELEELYRESTEDVLEELAWHFEQAGLFPDAVEYLYLAGNSAVRLSANVEAINHFNHGLELLESLPETIDLIKKELDLQIALFAPLAGAKGYGAPEVGKAYNRARELCEKVDDPDQLFQVLYGLWGHNLVRSELRTSRELAQECLDLAQRVGKTAFLMEAHRMTDETAFYLGEFGRARQHFEVSLALYDPKQHRAHAEVYGQDPGVALLSHGCCILWHLGYPDQALTLSQQAIALAEEQDHPFSLAFALTYSAMFHQYRREAPEVQKLAESAIQFSREQGFILWVPQASILRAWALVEQGQLGEGIAGMQQGLADWRAMGQESLVVYTMALLAEAYGKIGQIREALSLLDEAFAMVSTKDQGMYEAELYRLKGTLLQDQGQPVEEVEVQFNKAIEVARKRDARSQELRAVTSLTRLWQHNGKGEAARQMLAEIYDKFDEGLDTADLRDAHTLLTELGVKVTQS